MEPISRHTASVIPWARTPVVILVSTGVTAAYTGSQVSPGGGVLFRERGEEGMNGERKRERERTRERKVEG